MGLIWEKKSLTPSPRQGKGKGEGVIPLPIGREAITPIRRCVRGTHPTGTVKLFNAFVLVVYFAYPFQAKNFPCFIGSDRFNSKLLGNSNHFRYLFSIAFCHHTLLQIEIVF